MKRGEITVARPDPRSGSVVLFVNGFPVFIGTEAEGGRSPGGVNGP